MIEAMAAGCSVLVSTEVNLARQITAADAGVVTTLSVDDIATALRSLLDSPARRALMGSRGRAFAQRFDWQFIAPELVRMFHEVAEEERADQPRSQRRIDRG